MAKSLYVGNLSYSTTESDLVSHFSEFGGASARIIDGRGFGFIDVSEEKMQLAIDAKHGKDLSGRTLTVNEAKPRGTETRNSSRNNSW